jgi:hypothetical protein
MAFKGETPAYRVTLPETEIHSPTGDDIDVGLGPDAEIRRWGGSLRRDHLPRLRVKDYGPAPVFGHRPRLEAKAQVARGLLQVLHVDFDGENVEGDTSYGDTEPERPGLPFLDKPPRVAGGPQLGQVTWIDELPVSRVDV